MDGRADTTAAVVGLVTQLLLLMLLGCPVGFEDVRASVRLYGLVCDSPFDDDCFQSDSAVSQLSSGCSIYFLCVQH